MAVAALTGCGSSESAPSTQPPASAPAAPSAASPAAELPAPAGPGTAPVAAAPASPGPAVPGVPALTGNPTDLTVASQAQAGTGQPPTTVLTQDVVVGTGAKVTSDDTTVQVRYTGTLFAGGKVFDSSWTRGTQPVAFPLENLVPGFSQGLTGMKQGGRRVIVIPPALGYGNSTDGPIPGGSTLVFVVDLIGVT
jgi:peptidylprolyl isomerase